VTVIADDGKESPDGFLWRAVARVEWKYFIEKRTMARRYALEAGAAGDCESRRRRCAPRRGETVVVLGSGWPGILLHEAIGHGLEGDFNRKGTSAFANRIGQQVASELCTVHR